MTAQDYLLSLLQNSASTEITPQEKKIIEHQGIGEFIYQKLTTKKFRKYKMQDGCEERTRKAISIKTKQEAPMRIVYPQGGYKLWRFPSTTEADWAEFFNISYILNYVAPIAKAYKPGVHITYYMHTLLMERHDNLSQEEIQSYVDSFQGLIDAFTKQLPGNIKIDILRDADLYSRDEYFEALEAGTTGAAAKYDELPEEKKERYKSMARLNIKWNGAEDWTVLTPEEKEDKLRMAAIYEMAATSELNRVSEAVKSDENVLVFTVATPQFIGVGSTKASIAKYWVGTGVLVSKGDSYSSVVLTPSQFEKAKEGNFKTEKISVISGSNFKQVMVFDKPFSFHEQ